MDNLILNLKKTIRSFEMVYKMYNEAIDDKPALENLEVVLQKIYDKWESLVNQIPLSKYVNKNRIEKFLLHERISVRSTHCLNKALFLNIIKYFNECINQLELCWRIEEVQKQIEINKENPYEKD